MSWFFQVSAPFRSRLEVGPHTAHSLLLYWPFVDVEVDVERPSKSSRSGGACDARSAICWN
jgi:hypothetical protein